MPAGTVLASRRKGAVDWQARISQDRGRLEVVGLVPASPVAITIEPLTNQELLELLGERCDVDDTFAVADQRVERRLRAV